MQVLISLFFGTFLAEDLTAIAAGVLVLNGQVGLTAAVSATALGIFAGDLLLWGVGRMTARRAFRWGWVQRHVREERLEGFRRAFNRRAPILMLASRILPGTRLPLYLSAGAAGGTLGRFTVWSAVGTALWTPALVIAGSKGAAVAATIGGVLAVASGLKRWDTTRARSRIVARVSKLWRWEFWPMWAFYPPVAIWTLVLACRYRGFGVVCAANPGITDGGVVGESKYEILRRLPPEWVIPTLRVDAGTDGERARALSKQMDARKWSFPLVLKPDVGQRGVGVRIVRSIEQADAYLEAAHGAVLAQPFHEGPYEAGIFYYRKPSWPRGLILSITDKQFPVLCGDGRSTIEELIWAHPRYRMQAKRFLTRHASVRGRILDPGETFVLARAGNHAQGTMFLDGAHLITPALESRIDAIARAFPGFFIGRFDVRYGDPESFKAGRDVAIVELNGATAEATDIYDPSRSLWSAYRTLFRQWQLVFEIGAENRRRGAAVSSPRRLATLIAAHLASRPAHAVSD